MFCSLTPADSVETGHIVAIVTLQALVMVTGFAFMAVIVQLGRTNLTAAAAIGHRTDARRAHGPLRWTLTHLRTPRSHLQTRDRQTGVRETDTELSLSLVQLNDARQKLFINKMIISEYLLSLKLFQTGVNLFIINGKVLTMLIECSFNVICSLIMF